MSGQRFSEPPAQQSRLTVVQVRLRCQAKLAQGQLAALTGGASSSWSLLGNLLDSVARLPAKHGESTSDFREGSERNKKSPTQDQDLNGFYQITKQWKEIKLSH